MEKIKKAARRVLKSVKIWTTPLKSEETPLTQPTPSQSDKRYYEFGQHFNIWWLTVIVGVAVLIFSIIF